VRGLSSRGRRALAGLIAIGAAVVLTGTNVGAQNLDQGKAPAKLFADGCASCHRSPRGLAKGRFRLTLYLFLKEHYVSGSEQAWALASYLESVDAGAAGKPRTAAKPKHPAAGAARSSPRPPATVPER
jgi:mono/diheme cytochrome c family protein